MSNRLPPFHSGLWATRDAETWVAFSSQRLPYAPNLYKSFAARFGASRS
jgi:hypothetical protein